MPRGLKQAPEKDPAPRPQGPVIALCPAVPSPPCLTGQKQWRSKTRGADRGAVQPQGHLCLPTSSNSLGPQRLAHTRRPKRAQWGHRCLSSPGGGGAGAYTLELLPALPVDRQTESWIHLRPAGCCHPGPHPPGPGQGKAEQLGSEKHQVEVASLGMLFHAHSAAFLPWLAT